MELIIRTFDLKLQHTFSISRKSIDIQPTVIVELKCDDISGYGEATSNPYYNITTARIVNDLEKVQTIIAASSDCKPEEFWNTMQPHFTDNLFALCALDVAFTDLYARRKNKKLYQLWNYSIHNNALTDYTIGIDTIEKMVQKMKEKPWPIYKIKLGTTDDLAIVTELRKHTDAIFRIDANCGWSVRQTLENSVSLKKLGVEFLEQPLPADNWDGHAELFKKSALPIVADESCIIETDVLKCHNHFHGVNVKLMKCGGITPAKRMIEQARQLGLKTMVGCMTESTVGISAIAHLLPLLDYVDMDGALLLKEDIAKGVTISNGKIEYADVNGTGVRLH
ncbi:dipeptide epimerase [Flavobacterium sp.]|uniref:dipeptide epimerase n=1 Tax=Flavobacterium sp. TaxID=239 RepID=UPI002631F928|nr:dipeptide epimerase [Flavobacterium sp.]MDG2433259.1 dipeptide epimerase [Flavobacterium sp.]